MKLHKPRLLEEEPPSVLARILDYALALGAVGFLVALYVAYIVLKR